MNQHKKLLQPDEVNYAQLKYTGQVRFSSGQVRLGLVQVESGQVRFRFYFTPVGLGWG